MEQTQSATEKLAYEAPKAEFVPLQAEERLLACDKGAMCIGSSNS